VLVEARGVGYVLSGFPGSPATLGYRRHCVGGAPDHEHRRDDTASTGEDRWVETPAPNPDPIPPIHS